MTNGLHHILTNAKFNDAIIATECGITVAILCRVGPANRFDSLHEPAITQSERFMARELQFEFLVVEKASQSLYPTGDLLQLRVKCRLEKINGLAEVASGEFSNLSATMNIEPIYLDHQASTPTDPEAVAAMSRYWTEEFGNPHSSKHAFGWRADDAVTAGRQSVADLIGATAEEVVFTSGATEANNLAILGLLQHADGTGRNVVVSAIEHKCVLESARQLERNGYEVRKAPVLPTGHVDLEALATLVDGETDLVSVMLVNNEIGTVQPVAEVAELCRAVGAALHCDAAQAPTGVAIDVEALGVDMLSLSSHKMYGPKGIGALFVSHSIRGKIRPIIHGGGQEGGLRSGTLPTPLCVGFGEAARIMMKRRETDARHLAACRTAFLEAFGAGFPNFAVNGDEPKHPGHLNILLRNVDAEDLTTNMQPALAVSTGAACSSGMPESSHALRALGLSVEESSECVRIGFGRFSDEKQARAAAEIIVGAIIANQSTRQEELNSDAKIVANVVT
jgi:cysteine desulfurase